MPSSWSTPLDKAKLTVREITLFGMLAALTFGAKVAMSALPNIEPVSLMLLLFGAVFGWKALFPTYVYVLAEMLFYGLGAWNFNYLYIWVIPVVAAVLLRKMRHPLGWALVSGVYGLAFGALCAPVDVLIGGWGYAVAKWVSGIPFDITHCVGNFAIALLLFGPLRALLEKLHRRMEQ